MSRLQHLITLGSVGIMPRSGAFAVNEPSGICADSLSVFDDGDGHKIYLGDVIQVPSGPGVYSDLKDEYFRVTRITSQGLSFSPPYHDKACTRRYRPDF